MFSGPRKIITIAVAMAVVFAVGLTQLFLLRFKAGDVYPPYSSLRTDPLGIQALYESLQRVAADNVTRNFQPPDRIRVTSDTTVLVSGLSDKAYLLASKKFSRLMDHLSVNGGRLVLTFTSRGRRHGKPQKETPDPSCPEEEGGGQEEGEGQDEPQPCPEEQSGGEEPVEDQWMGADSMGFEITPLAWDTGEDPVAVRSGGELADLPPVIPWRPAVAFDLQDTAWRTLYAFKDQPVVVHRAWGRATVVMMADSYLLSNEALRNHRQTALLGWLAGQGRQVVFDEAHHGLSHRPGIATLARRYRLHGVFGALLVVTILFFWRQTAVFVPPPRDPREEGRRAPAAGRDTGEGLVDLARGHIGNHQLLPVCHDAWRSYGARRVPRTVATEIETLIRQAAADPKQHDPVEIYRRICTLIKKGKRQP